MTPFEQFWTGTYRGLVDRLPTSQYADEVVTSNGMRVKEVSWDRQAAFLLWLLINGKDPP